MKANVKFQRIETIRKKYRKEWLLIAVGKTDFSTTTPLTGRLLAHSPCRDDIYRLESKHKGHTLTLYSEDGMPKGYAAAF